MTDNPFASAWIAELPALDEIEKLRAENDVLRQALAIITRQNDADDGDVNKKPVWRIRAENERLREALRYYADDHANPADGPWGLHSNDFGNRALAALRGKAEA